MDGYYDPTPTVTLDRPVAVTGCVGSDLHSVCAWICQFTGLRLSEIARDVEHTAGRGRAHVVEREGTDGLQRRQAEALRRALRGLPPGIIAVGVSYLAPAFNAGHLARSAQVVHLDRPLEFVQAFTRERLAQHPDDALAVYPSADPSAQDIERHWARLRREGARAAVRVDLGTLRGHAAARAVMHALGWF